MRTSKIVAACVALLLAAFAPSAAPAGSFAFNGANFASQPIQLGTPIASAGLSLGPTATTHAAILCKSNRVGLTIRGFGAQTGFDTGVRFDLEVAIDGGSTFVPLKTYSAVPGVQTAVASGKSQGIFDSIDLPAGTRVRLMTYAWGTTPTSGYGLNVQFYC